MLLYSTILEIKESLTKDDFVKMLIEWNQKTPHAQNRIQNMEWNGERNVRYGSKDLWLEIIEYRNHNIIAARYEKVGADGAVWDTDYVMNFDDRRMVIQLDRSYKEGALNIDPKFIAPYFITMLIERGYLKDDGGLPILREPTLITKENADILTDIITGKSKYRLPVVYVSKTDYNQNSCSVGWLCNRLKGIAHVLVEADKSVNEEIRQICNGKNEYNGAVGIYYPSSAFGHRKFASPRWNEADAVLIDKIERNVIQYWISQNVDHLYTWQGVYSSLLNDRLNCQREKRVEAETAKEMAESELNQYFEQFDEDLDALQKRIEELSNANEALRYENQGLRTKLNAAASLPLLYFGQEDDFYQGEIKDIVLSTLEEAAKNTPAKTRRADVLRDIVENNSYQHLTDERKKKVKTLLKGYKSVSGAMRQALMNLGFEITEEGKHYKLTYYGDRRYMTTLAKTPSDGHGTSNQAAQICKDML